LTNTFKTRSVEPDITVVELSGKLHLGNTLSDIEAGIKKMIGEGCRKMVIDLTELGFIDSAAIGMLIGCNGAMEQAGGALRIAGAHGTVAKVFEVVHMSRIVGLDPDVATACGSLA
jgi:anti-sigma B factor antagonist